MRSLLCQFVLGFFRSFSASFLNFNLWSFLVELHELGEIELGFLEELDLSDEDVLEWEDF